MGRVGLTTTGGGGSWRGKNVRLPFVIVALLLLFVSVVFFLPNKEHHLHAGAEAPGGADSGTSSNPASPGDSGGGGDGSAVEVETAELHGVRGTEDPPAVPRGEETLMILMVSDNPYQVWQMRVFHYHYLKVKQPGKLVTIVSSPDHAPPSFTCDQPFMTCPLFVTGDYSTAPDGDNFVVYNRAHGLLEFLTAFRENKVAGLDPRLLTNIVIVEPDFLLIKPITAVAARQAPLGHSYFYMEEDYSWGSNNTHVYSFCTPRSDKMSPIGVPYIIHADDLWELIPSWIASTRWNRFPQPWANGDKSWIADMWGFACAAATLGWDAHAIPGLAPEPPIDTDVADLSVAIHYTYGQEAETAAAKWSFDKRGWWDAPRPRPLPEFPIPAPGEQDARPASPLQHLWFDLLNEALINVFGKANPPAKASQGAPLILQPKDTE